ncbi:ABC transporter permease [Nocardioides sp. AE5]|uniref:ABC transporter permease n=1 Tax=Nocardioides sp. AE5 TaxID=2962573 RepID=UPI002881FBB4|nr:ABC transporter permease [Nocardioides sp. AE5]MDT0203926.1 ABC transporter permease [Nocardioides sp. AE5]
MMIRVLRRVGVSAVSVLLVVLVVFLLMQAAPGDAAEAVVGSNATQEEVDAARERLGLDRSMAVQFGSWLLSAVQGDFGTSLYTDRSVAESLMQAAPATISISIVAILLAAVLGVTAGTLAGLRRDSWIDRGVSLLATLGIAMPSFWVGLLLVSIFSFQVNWLPATGYVPITEGLGEWLRHIILPAVALALAMTAEIARQTRGGVVDVLSRPYVLAARARGANGGWLVRKHVLRNSAIPVVTVFGLQSASLLGGVVIIEAVFGVSGLGTLAITAVVRQDYPVVQAYVVLVAVIVITINLIVDVSYGWINPKVRS